MGVFYVNGAIENIVDRSQKAELPQMLVDTGSEYTWVPEDTLEKLGITREKKDLEFVRANDKTITRSVGFAIVRCEDAFTVDEVVFAEPGDLLLLGARTLEGMNLTVDSRLKKLVAAGPLPAARVFNRALGAGERSQFRSYVGAEIGKSRRVGVDATFHRNCGTDFRQSLQCVARRVAARNQGIELSLGLTDFRWRRDRRIGRQFERFADGLFIIQQPGLQMGDCFAKCARNRFPRSLFGCARVFQVLELAAGASLVGVNRGHESLQSAVLYLPHRVGQLSPETSLRAFTM